MNQQTGYYSLIQFCPDPSRLEGVNIGVGLYWPTQRRVLVQITPNNHRIRRFFGNQDWRLVSRAKASIENQLKSQQFLSVEEFEAYISKRANLIRLSSPRPLEVTDPQTNLKELFERLVRPEVIRPKTRINGFLTKKLKEAGVANMVRKSVEVEIPEIKDSIRVPYGYQNGRFNLIAPVQFDSDPDAIITKTGKSALEGKLLFERLDPSFGEMRLVVVANFDDQIESSTRDFVRRTLDEHSVKFYSFDDLSLLLSDIRDSAISHGL